VPSVTNHPEQSTGDGVHNAHLGADKKRQNLSSIRRVAAAFGFLTEVCQKHRLITMSAHSKVDIRLKLSAIKGALQPATVRCTFRRPQWLELIGASYLLI
jgi:hypothetical protein